MESDNQLSPTLSKDTILSTERATKFLPKAELHPPHKVQCLSKLPTTDFECSLSVHADTASTLLAQHRIADPKYRQPDHQKRDFFRGSERKKAVRDEANWVFTKHEVAVVFGELLSKELLAAPGVAQALLSRASVPSLQELWLHSHDRKLDKRMKSRFRSSKTPEVPDIPWLDSVTRRDNVEYVRLMCQAGLDQKTLNRAFGFALEQRLLDIMETLLSFGAVATPSHDKIRELLRSDDIDLARLLLSAPPAAMSVEAWRFCLDESVADKQGPSPSIVLLCVSNRPNIICGPLLLHALAAQNFQSSTALLAYANKESELSKVAQQACELASKIQDADCRYDFFTLLADSELVADSSAAREELMTDAKIRHFPLLRLLVAAGVALDLAPHDAVTHTVSNMDLEVLELFNGGKFHTPASVTLDSVPPAASEPLMLQLIDILAPRGLYGKPMDAFLVRAAQEQYAELAERLVGLGASIEYEEALAVQVAIANENFSMLDILLKGPCSAEILSAALTPAITLRSRMNRHQVLETLLAKGVLQEQLGISLQQLVVEDDDIDSKLVQLLLQHGAPIDGIGDEKSNAVLQTARRGDVVVLAMLCWAEPRMDTLSKAVPVAYDSRHTCGNDIAWESIKVLLEKGAAGKPIHETLLSATGEAGQLEIVRLLTDHGADANFSNGAAFRVALESTNNAVLEIFCQKCPPSKATIEAVLYTAIDPNYYSLQTLQRLLDSAPSAGAALDAAWNASRLQDNLNLNEIVECFLQHGLDVNLRDGAVLWFAVHQTDTSLLRLLIPWGPNLTSITAAFHEATRLEQRELQVISMSLLLETAQSDEIGQSEALLKQTQIAFTGDMTGLKLLLRHRAAIDFDRGAAVRAAASAGNIKVLDLLLSHTPALSTLHLACLAAAGSTKLDDGRRRPVFDSLLDARDRELTEAEHMTQLLADSVTTLPDHTQLPVMLIMRGAKVQFETLRTALRTSSRGLFKALTANQDRSTILEAFREACVMPMPSERKYWINESLLRRGIPRDEVSMSLVQALQEDVLGDLALPKLLLEHGASVSYRNCSAFVVALFANSLVALKLLSQYLRDDDTACVAFDLARNAVTLSPDVRASIYASLLQWNISTPAVYAAFVSHLEGDHTDIAVVQLLLAKGADPNQEAGRCFVIAAKNGQELIFRELSKGAELSLMLRALIRHFQLEWEIVLWFNMCLEEQHHLTTIEDQDLLYLCMARFPSGSGLLRILLDRGVSPAAPIEVPLATGWEPEWCTPLIWALRVEPKVNNDVILTLLDRGGHEALPTYSTPTSKVTAAFACLFDASRAPILRALLHLDRASILESFTPVATFIRFLDSSQSDGLPAELDPRSASMMLGNFDAYRALELDETVDEGDLHLAAFVALPKFVEWFLNFNDANSKVRGEFDQMIPLAIACTARPVSWCRIADQEADFSTRRKQCIELLVPRTNAGWRYRDKTVLHIALENGLEVTSIVLQALNMKVDPERNEKYLHQSKDGVQYSPDQYVLQRMPDVSVKEKAALVLCLRHNGIESRYFRRVKPGEGEQPEGYHGLPPGLAAEWETYANPVASQSTSTLAPSASYSNR
ncbi:hypothetical protein BDV96DRAFT_487778 [Lophiotrema nucula]|uniref:Ankyrin repeat-containing domain protein n=1 Tax=Lophiotrema nucula TaxID=690887 RepID=A0A6A5ZIU2_9PLEO|nr:hypothetical protein BDV96DRAFT_487778 [Lophiotrema nucula]